PRNRSESPEVARSPKHHFSRRAYLLARHQPRLRASLCHQAASRAGRPRSRPRARYNLGLCSIVEFTEAELQKPEADIADTDATYQYRLTQTVLAFTIAAPK